MTSVLVLLLAAFIFIPGPKKTDPNSSNITTNSENVELYNLKANQIIRSPAVILGEAAGWYFEGSFPGGLYDADGALLAPVIAQAKGDWMTTAFVPFEIIVEFGKPLTKTGYLYLNEDDPSGLNQNLEFVKIPIVFEDYVQETSEIKVFFSNSNLDPEVTCVKVFPVSRKIVKTEAVGRAALEALLKGPTQKEDDNGYQTNLNDGVRLNSLKIYDGLAEADFSEELDKGGGSCWVSVVRAQIDETLKQFPTVKNVKISINGRSGDILQP